MLNIVNVDLQNQPYYVNSKMTPKISKMHFFPNHSFIFSFIIIKRPLIRYRNTV